MKKLNKARHKKVRNKRGAEGWHLVVVYQMLWKTASEDTCLLLRTHDHTNNHLYITGFGTCHPKSVSRRVTGPLKCSQPEGGESSQAGKSCHVRAKITQQSTKPFPAPPKIHPMGTKVNAGQTRPFHLFPSTWNVVGLLGVSCAGLWWSFQQIWWFQDSTQPFHPCVLFPHPAWSTGERVKGRGWSVKRSSNLLENKTKRKGE